MILKTSVIQKLNERISVNKKQQRYGSWSSELSPTKLASAGSRFGHLVCENQKLFWLESLPTEGGRVVIRSVTLNGADSQPQIISPADVSVRTRAHEYGGADFAVSGDTLVYCDDADQRLYTLNLNTADSSPRAITPSTDFKHQYRYADMDFSVDANWLVCVRETHTEDGDPLSVVNDIVNIALDKADEIGEPKVLASGADFYSYPRVSPNGKQLSWTSWQHPNMPWDQTELWVAELNSHGHISSSKCLLQNKNESIYQPTWSPDGVLHFVSDRNGWWNIYSFLDDILNCLTPINAEFGFPQWQFGTVSYAFIDSKRIIAAYVQDGREHLCLVEPDQGHMTPVELPYCSYQGGLYYLQKYVNEDVKEYLYFIAADESSPPAVIQWDILNQQAKILSENKPAILQESDVSIAEAIEFKTSNNEKAHAFYYTPKNSSFEGLANELPPLIVMSHGGPTASASAEFNIAIQFWTHRGFAVVDVNYRGSTGYGKEYRDALKYQWGVLDVDDCVNAAKFLIKRGSVDESRIAIRGGSAGGYTTYSALMNHSFFAAGVSRYGVADLKCLVVESHKFEVRYLDSMIGPWPQEETLYEQRSPINHAQNISCPVLLLQGDEDAVVPPAQSLAMADALDANEVPHALIMLEGEQHGFRQSKNIARALELELNFYAQVFRIELGEPLASLVLKHSQNI